MLVGRAADPTAQQVDAFTAQLLSLLAKPMQVAQLELMYAVKFGQSASEACPERSFTSFLAASRALDLNGSTVSATSGTQPWTKLNAQAREFTPRSTLDASAPTFSPKKADIGSFSLTMMGFLAGPVHRGEQKAATMPARSFGYDVKESPKPEKEKTKEHVRESPKSKQPNGFAPGSDRQQKPLTFQPWGNLPPVAMPGFPAANFPAPGFPPPLSAPPPSAPHEVSSGAAIVPDESAEVQAEQSVSPSTPTPASTSLAELPHFTPPPGLAAPENFPMDMEEMNLPRLVENALLHLSDTKKDRAQSDTFMSDVATTAPSSATCSPQQTPVGKPLSQRSEEDMRCYSLAEMRASRPYTNSAAAGLGFSVAPATPKGDLAEGRRGGRRKEKEGRPKQWRQKTR
jgi:hypothetical protein